MSDFDQRGLIARLEQLKGTDSVARFAADCGLGESIMRKYFSGATPGLDKAAQVSRAKGVTLEWLAFGGALKHGPDPSLSAFRQSAAPYDTDEEFVEVPHYSVRASAGLGSDAGDIPPTHYNKFRRDWWTRKIGVDADACFSLDVEGDSMAPRITDRDLPIIDRKQSKVLSEGIFVFRLDGQVFVKYLERKPGMGLVARSENPRYESFEIGDGAQFSDFRVIGRAIYKGSGERL